ncbi:MAG: BlaI/MecI/CopY family transcriptional regulator [Acidobacteriota bacterium]
MSTTRPPRPTDAELSVLDVLWQRGPSTVREVHEELQASQSTGYTTTLKVMQVMAGKGLLARDESARSHVYSACVRPEPVRRGLVQDLAVRAFSGSAAQLALAALASEPASAEELAEVRRLLDEMESGEGR